MYSVRDKSNPDLWRFKSLFEQLDYQQICSIYLNQDQLRKYLRVKPNEIEKYQSFLERIGFRSEERNGVRPNFKIGFSHDYFPSMSTARVIRGEGRIEIVLHDSIFEPHNFTNMIFRLITVLRNYQVGIEKIFDYSRKMYGVDFFNLDLGDGGVIYRMEVTPQSNLYAFTRRNELVNVGLVPDPYTLHDIETGINYYEYQSKEEAKKEYESRRKSIFWRGSTTGRAPQNQISENERVRFCLKSQNYEPLIDAKITEVVQFQDNEIGLMELQKMGIVAPAVSESKFAKYQAFIDIDGNSSGWGTFRKYLRLIHVIKPKSDFSMFYYLWQPQNTLTSIRDTDDLFESITNDADFPTNFEVAWNGYNFVRDARKKILLGEATIFPSDLPPL
jgi:hypothetical protein